jgi:hypothetical protein
MTNLFLVKYCHTSDVHFFCLFLVGASSSILMACSLLPPPSAVAAALPLPPPCVEQAAAVRFRYFAQPPAVQPVARRPQLQCCTRHAGTQIIDATAGQQHAERASDRGQREEPSQGRWAAARSRHRQTAAHTCTCKLGLHLGLWAQHISGPS